MQTLLERVAILCVLGHISESTATEMFRAAFANAREELGNDVSNQIGHGIDAFVAGQVLSEWHQNAAFLDRAGNPLPLSVSTGEFANLCATASVQSRADEVLNLLAEAGALTIDDDRASANRREFIIDYAHPTAVARAIRLSAEFTGTLRHNLSRNVSEPGLFERTVSSARLARRQLPSLLAYLSTHGESFLEDLEAWMSARESPALGPTIGVGVFLFVADDEA